MHASVGIQTPRWSEEKIWQELSRQLYLIRSISQGLGEPEAQNAASDAYDALKKCERDARTVGIVNLNSHYAALRAVASMERAGDICYHSGEFINLEPLRLFAEQLRPEEQKPTDPSYNWITGAH